MAQRVDDQHGNIFNPGDDLRRDVMAVAEIGGKLPSLPRKYVSVNEHFSVGHFGRRDLEIPDAERTGHLARIGADVIAESMLAIESVIKHSPQVAHCPGRGVNRHRAVGQFAKAPQVIEPGHVVGVGMGENRRVDPLQSLPQGLRAEIRRGIHQNDGLPGFHEDRGAQSPVALVVGPAYPAVAGYEGNALGRACSEERDRKFGHDGNSHLGIRCRVVATLASLRIKNLALVEDLTWEPGAGMVAITGETGAGKSILIGALQLLLGMRADKALIRSGEENCTVEAVFALAESKALDAWLQEQGAEPCAEGELIVKRSLSSSGPGRQFVNGSACTQALLKSLGDMLVDLHGPHDHQSLFSREAQTRVLDSYAGAAEVASDFLAAHREQARLAEEIARLRALEQDAAMRREMLGHAAKEIAESKLRVGEEEELVSRLRAAGNSQRLIELGTGLESLFGGEGDKSLRELFSEAVRLTRELARIDSAAEPLRESVESTAERFGEIETEVRHYTERIESDPATLRELEQRADLLQSLKRKYGGSIEEVIRRGEQAARDLEEIETRGERIESLHKEAASAATKADKLSAKLSAARKRAAPSLGGAITKELRDLGFLKAEFTVRLENLPEARSLGAELADFEFAPNPGEPAKPLREIASSGEISRVMLALKTVLAAQDRVPLLVFDEIDANVGGEVAVKVGRKMRKLGESHQVLCITHLPQVAASASRQFAVVKNYDGKRTSTSVDLLGTSERERELARMLGGMDSGSALAHARSLLNAAG